MRVLIACEESQAVCIRMREHGHEAYSCDILPCSGGYPEWHIQGDVIEQLDKRWDMMIAFPPCTFLTLTGNKWFLPEYKDRFPNREQDRLDAIKFFMALHDADINKIAIENPVGIMNTRLREPNQIIHPYYFGDNVQKVTCLWLKNLPLLRHYAEDDMFHERTHGEKEEMIVYKSGKTVGRWYHETSNITLKGGARAKARSKTFPGIAKAMAEQWG